MIIRRGLWAAIALLSVLALIIVGLIGWVLVRPRAESSALVVIGADGRLRLLAGGARGGEERVLAENVRADGYLYPAVSADGRKLAYMAADGAELALFQLDLASGKQQEVYRSSDEQPIDIGWSPDGKYLVWLAGGSKGFTVSVAAADGSTPPQSVSAGRATYFAWKPDSSALLLHVNGHMLEGGRVELFDMSQPRAAPILDDPGFFQAPAWGYDGQHLFYVAQPPIQSANPGPNDLQSDIVWALPDGTEPQVLASEKLADLRIVCAPTSDQLAYIALKPDSRGGAAWGPLKLIDGAGGAARVLSAPDAQVASFFWSPDGSKIAYLTYQNAFDPASDRTWHVVDVASGAMTTLESFAPSAPFAQFQIFFDAYTHGLSPWSPDSRRLTYGATDGVYVLDVASGKAERVADGMLGLWVAGNGEWRMENGEWRIVSCVLGI